jgi:hypothetical protein
MLGEWVLVGTGARRWGFDVIFFFFFSFSFFSFLCPFCILLVCLGASFTLFNDILFITYQKKNIPSNGDQVARIVFGGYLQRVRSFR